MLAAAGVGQARYAFGCVPGSFGEAMNDLAASGLVVLAGVSLGIVAAVALGMTIGTLLH
jgi:ABC-type nitrate/sulfonate/bicarbonate transport system permease component